MLPTRFFAFGCAPDCLYYSRLNFERYSGPIEDTPQQHQEPRQKKRRASAEQQPEPWRQPFFHSPLERKVAGIGPTAHWCCWQHVVDVDVAVAVAAVVVVVVDSWRGWRNCSGGVSWT